MKRSNRGVSAFNLIEIMIVIVIVGILMNMAIPAYRKHINRTKVQNAATQIARDIEWARSLSLKYEKSVYVALEDKNNNSSDHHVKIYMDSGVPGEGLYGTQSQPFLLRNIYNDYGGVSADFVGVTGLAIGPGGCLYDGSGVLSNPVTIQAMSGGATSSFKVEGSGTIVFGQGGM